MSYPNESGYYRAFINEKWTVVDVDVDGNRSKYYNGRSWLNITNLESHQWRERVDMPTDPPKPEMTCLCCKSTDLVSNSLCSITSVRCLDCGARSPYGVNEKEAYELWINKR